MRRREDVVHLDGSRAVRVHLLVPHRFDPGFLRGLRQRVVQQRAWRVEGPLEELLVVPVRDDGRAFGHQRGQSAGVIGVWMRGHDVADWLVGNQLLGFSDIGQRARLALPGLEHHDVVPELHDQRIVAAGSGGEPVQAVTELFGRDRERRCGAASARATTGCPAATATTPTSRRCRGSSQRRDIGRIELRGRDVDLKERPPAARLHDLRRRHGAAAEILPAGVGGDDMHVAHDVVAEPCLDAIDQVPVVHVAVDDVGLAGWGLDRRTPCQHGGSAAAGCGGVVVSRALQEAPGREVELERVVPRLRDVRLLRRDLLEERSGDRCRGAATCWIVGRAGVTRRRRRQVDDADVVVDRPHRIVRAATDRVDRVGAALLERDILRRSGIGDGCGIAQCLLRVGDDGL